jgi:dihydrofolate reductase
MRFARRPVWIDADQHRAAKRPRRGLVDEYQLMIHPVALGAGTRFWPMLDGPLWLRMTEMRRFASGVMLLSYAAA